MNMISFKASFRRISDLLEDADDIRWKQDGYLILSLFAIVLLTGPLCLLGWWMQRWNSIPSWDTEDHWTGTKRAAITFAGLGTLLLVALLHFHPPLAAFWYLLLWYGFCASLAPAFALVAERIDPRTIASQRILLPSEQPAPSAVPPPQQVTASEQPAPPARKKRAATKKPTTSMTSKQELDKKLTKKMNKGRPIPLGDLLLQEQEERERRRTQINYVQAPFLPAEAENTHPSPANTDGLKTEERPALNSDASSSESASEPPPAQKKPERRQPESLDNLF